MAKNVSSDFRIRHDEISRTNNLNEPHIVPAPLLPHVITESSDLLVILYFHQLSLVLHIA